MTEDYIGMFFVHDGTCWKRNDDDRQEDLRTPDGSWRDVEYARWDIAILRRWSSYAIPDAYMRKQKESGMSCLMNTK